MTDVAQMQRSAPPMDRWSTRRLEAGGGIDTVSPRTLAPGIEDTLARYPATVFDGLVQRDRGPYYQRPVYVPPPVTWVSWTEAGPTRPELHMRCVTNREMVGNTRSRYPVVKGAPTTGMHTMTQSGTSRTIPRFVTTPQMTAARQFRLSPGVYNGQTYSQTTRLQGG